MAGNEYSPDTGRIELGAASVETKGVDGNDIDSAQKRLQSGLSDD